MGLEQLAVDMERQNVARMNTPTSINYVISDTEAQEKGLDYQLGKRGLMLAQNSSQKKDSDDKQYEYNPEGWKVPIVLNPDGTLAPGIKKLGARWFDRNKNGKKETWGIGYRLSSGRVVTTLQYDKSDPKSVYSIQLNKTQTNAGALISRVDPEGNLTSIFSYKIIGNNSHPMPKCLWGL